MAKGPSEADHWRIVHGQISELITEAGFQRQGGRLFDPSRPAAMAKSVRPASSSRAAQFTALRAEVMQSLSAARDSVDYASRLELISLRDELARQAAS